MSRDLPFRDAEAWLAEQGVERVPLRVDPETPPDAAPGEAPSERPPAARSDPDADPGQGTGSGPANTAGSASPAPAHPPAPARGAVLDEGDVDPSAPTADRSDRITATEAMRLAGQADADATLRQADASAAPDLDARGLGDDVADALAFVRRSTANTPQAEARVAEKLTDRGWGPAIIDRAMEQARLEGLVDDPAMVVALVAERRAKGHAPFRIRRDLQQRGFPDTLLDEALAPAESEDQEAAAFAVAKEKADRSTGLSAESAFRRVVGHVARRGYPEGLARKVAREAVFTAREQERTAGH